MLNENRKCEMRTFWIYLVASFGIACSAGAAIASYLPAHVDASMPHTQPGYPDSARASGEQGTVLVAVYVHPNGRISKYRVAQSSGFGDLDDAAVESVLAWRFVPATRDGDAVSDWATVRIVFQLPQPLQPPPSQSK